MWKRVEEAEQEKFCSRGICEIFGFACFLSYCRELAPISRQNLAGLLRRVLEMFSRRNFVTFSILTYLVLLIFYFAFNEREVQNNACTYGRTCIRFCCTDANLCKANVIREHFNASFMPKPKDDDESDFIIMYGRPQCTTLVPFESDREWQFTDVRLEIFAVLNNHFLECISLSLAVS